MSQVSAPPALPAVLRFADGLTPTVYFRTASIAHTRGLLRPQWFRLLDFLQRQDLDTDGRIIGMRQTDQVSGGLDLAHRYGLAHGIGPDRYWADLGGLLGAGYVEQAVLPAPGRKAVYRLCLRADAIPADLPDDLTRMIRPWDLPEPVDPHEDAVYGRLTSRPALPMQRGILETREGMRAYDMAQAVAKEPRWQHPEDSPAAVVAAELRTAGKALPEPDRAAALRAAEVEADTPAERRPSVYWEGVAKRLPYTRGGFPPCGLLSADRRGLMSWDEMAQAKTTPSAAPTRKCARAVAADLASSVDWVVRRAWAVWRAQLGRSEVILRAPSPEAASRSLTGSSWSDLQRVVGIALRRGATPTLVLDLMTSGVVRRNEWGEIVWKPDNVAVLAAHRLWRWINATPDAPHYARRRPVRQAAHVTAWDDPTTAELDARRRRALDAQAAREAHLEALALEAEARAEARRRRQEAERSEYAERWGLDRFARPAADPAAHREEIERMASLRRQTRAHATPGDRSRAAALEIARAQKRARRREEGQ